MRSATSPLLRLPLLALVFTSCVTVKSPAMEHISTTGLTRQQASQDLLKGARAARRCDGGEIRDIRVRGAGFELTDAKGQVFKFSFADIPSESFLPPPWFTNHYALPGYELCWSSAMGIGGPDEQLFMNALTYFQQEAREHAAAYAESAAFDLVVDRYRAMKDGALPEEARRHQVQAFGAVDERRFSDAAESFQQALDIAPWWSQGYFNLALTQAELGDLRGAVEAMGKYLKLEPSAPDFREAQDKIYEWEGKEHRAPLKPSEPAVARDRK
jgi:tetratricopeptide (TPR) repeat protein